MQPRVENGKPYPNIVQLSTWQSLLFGIYHLLKDCPASITRRSSKHPTMQQNLRIYILSANATLQMTLDFESLYISYTHDQSSSIYIQQVLSRKPWRLTKRWSCIISNGLPELWFYCPPMEVKSLVHVIYLKWYFDKERRIGVFISSLCELRYFVYSPCERLFCSSDISEITGDQIPIYILLTLHIISCLLNQCVQITGRGDGMTLIIYGWSSTFVYVWSLLRNRTTISSKNQEMHMYLLKCIFTCSFALINFKVISSKESM